MKKIKILLDYKCYPMWIYSEENELIDNDLVEELKDDVQVDNVLMKIQNIYDKLFEDNEVSFGYQGFKDEKEKENFILEVENAIELIKSKVDKSYMIENCVEI